jgi:hypothetical protein
MKNKKQNEGKKLEEKLRERKFMLDKQFQFTPENIEKIKDFSEALLRKSHELFDKINNIKRNLDLQIGSKDYSCLIDEQYFICGNISIDSDKQELYDVVNRQQSYSISTSFGTDSFDRVSTLLECDNWDIENLQPLNKYSVHICYAMHHFFTDGLFALSDILLLDKDDIQLSISIEL